MMRDITEAELEVVSGGQQSNNFSFTSSVSASGLSGPGRASSTVTVSECPTR